MLSKMRETLRDKVQERLVDLCEDLIYREEEGMWPSEAVYHEVSAELCLLYPNISRFDMHNILENEVRMQAVRHIVRQAYLLKSKPLTAYQWDALKALKGMRNSTAELVSISRKLHGEEYKAHCLSLGKVLKDLVKRNLIGIRVHGDGRHAAILYFLTREGRRTFNA